MFNNEKEDTNMTKISAYIIAYNEETKIKAAIESVLWADEVIVADSFSTDKTAAIAQSLGAKVVQVTFTGFGDLRNKAVAECAHEWIFSLDADERCTPEAKEEILQIINNPDSLDVYHVPRKNIFLGRWIKHAWAYPNYRQPQLFRKEAMEYKPELKCMKDYSQNAKAIGIYEACDLAISIPKFRANLAKS